MSRGPFIRTSKNRIELSRRTFLRGSFGATAIAMALPTLDIMLNSNGTAHADGTALPQRFVVWYWGNGVVTNRWVPTATGTGYALSESLQPFANVKDYLSIISGTALSYNLYAHYTGASFLLTGDNTGNLGTGLGGPALRESFDQTIARAIAGSTPFKSVQVGIADPVTTRTLMLDSISHSGPGSPLRADPEPSSVFNRLFGETFKPPAASTTPAGPSPRDVRRGQMLDAVKQDAARLRSRLGNADQKRLDEHLTSISDLQKRLTQAQLAAPASCSKPTLGGFSTYTEKTNVMNEILRLAFACDLTRVVSYMWSAPASQKSYPEINVNTAFHANICHQETAPQAVYATGVKYFMSRFASFLEAMKGTAEGAGNMLDNMCVFGTSCVATQTAGGAHSNYDWPLLVAGRAGGRLKQGTHYRSASSENATNVPFTCMKAMGLPVTEYGVGSARTTTTVPILT